MARNGLKVEEVFLNKALEDKVALRLSLSSGERLTGVLSGAGRYDINLKLENGAVTLPKKEISHISYQKSILEDDFFESAPANGGVQNRSRVQDEFLERYVSDKTLALFVMVNGEELRGVLRGYDHYTLALKTNRGQVLLYKHGVCSMGPGYRGRPDRKNAG